MEFTKEHIGKIATDSVTGLVGTITAVAWSMGGYHSVELTPKVVDPSHTISPIWVNAERVAIG